MRDELLLAAREGFYSRMGAKMQALWESPIREQNISVKVEPRVVGKHKVRWNGTYGGVKGMGGVNGWVGGVMGLKGGVGGSMIIGAYVLVSEGCGMDSGGFMADGRG